MLLYNAQCKLIKTTLQITIYAYTCHVSTYNIIAELIIYLSACKRIHAAVKLIIERYNVIALADHCY